ncbi:MAG: phage baseplate assembly protein V [Selenomonadaceae bacterium]
MDKQTKNLFRIGTVCDLDAAGQRVRVNFDDLGTVSPWLQVPAFGANGDDYYWMPEVDEQVACFFMPTGNAEGYVLFSVRGSANAPKAGSASKRYIRFADGGVVEYDKGTSTLTIEAANIVIKGNITLTGGITSSADIVAAGISLDNHVHSGILPGGSNTGGPV